jgi:ATP-dependent Clp protease ATP-binding subunit ClpA
MLRAVFERFTDGARRVLVLAQEEAHLLNHSFIGTEHILLGLIHEGEGLAAKALESLGISLEAVRERVEETIGPAGTAPTGSPPFTPRTKKVLELSLREALQLGHNYIGTEHMLLGLVREGEGVAAQVLVSMGADLPRVRRQVIQLLSGFGGSEPGEQSPRFDVPEPASVEPRKLVEVGSRCRFEVVRAGRSKETAEEVFATMTGLLERLGLDFADVDQTLLQVTSVETEDGPGLSLVVHLNLEDGPSPPA